MYTSGDSAGSDDLILAAIPEMKKASSTLIADANTLSSDMSSFWSDFDFDISDFPSCLLSFLNQFENTQKKIYHAHVQKRLDLANALGNSTTLIKAVDKCCASSFNDPALANVSLSHLLPGQ